MDALDITFTIEPLNDEPPEVTNTPLEQTFTEQAGPINIVSLATTIVDQDNMPEHQLIRVLRVTLENPVQGEDVLIADNVSYASYLNFSCDMSADLSCYDDFLRRVQYNNTREEPNFTDCLVTIEVGPLLIHFYEPCCHR